MASLSKDDIRVLEQARLRLYNLTDSLNALNREIHTTHPLPSWPSLLSRFQILTTHLASLSSLLSAAQTTPLFSSLAVFPLPTFPGQKKEHEGVVTQLLRKKLEMGVEEWVDAGKGEGAKAEEGMVVVVGKGGGGGGKEGEEEGEGWRELWEWVMLKANDEGRGYAWGEGGSEEDEGEEEEEEEGKGEEGEEEVDGGMGMGMGELMRFMSTGVEVGT